jgi:hypothetical protein
MVGSLPQEDGTRMTKDIKFVGTDNTTITVKQNTSTVYKTEPRRMFEATPDNSVLFIFEFPPDTKSNSDDTVFTTPSKSVYTFSTKDGVSTNESTFKKIVTKGSISINPPPSNMVEDIVTQTQLPLGDDTATPAMNDSPFYNVTMIVYFVLCDLFVMVIFWVVFIVILCWLMVPAEYLYPTDIFKYPYVFYDPSGSKYYEYTSKDKDELCKTMPTDDLNEARTVQKAFFEELKGYAGKDENTDKVAILNIIYKGFLNPDPKMLNKFSQSINDTCRIGKDLSPPEHILYLVQLVAFKCNVYCTSTLRIVHSLLGYLCEKLKGPMNFNVPFISIALGNFVFAGILMSVFFSTGEVNNQVIKLFKIEFSKGTDTGTLALNQLIHFMVYLLTCFMLIFGQLFMPLLTVCMGIVLYTLLNTILSGYSMIMRASAFFMFISAILTFPTIGFVLSGQITFQEAISSSGEGDATMAAILTFFSAFSLGIPLLIAGGYSAITAGTIVVSLFDLIKIPMVGGIIQKTVPTLVILAFILLILRVNQVLGQTLALIAMMIVFLMGAGILLNTGGKPESPKINA